MSEDQTYRIRPAGRHILTIGRELIQDRYAAIVELVKNAYDADSPDVNIVFRAFDNRSRYEIVIEDHGHGMSRDTVINKWMVPSTDDKLSRGKSPGGRIMQGRKGIGRYAASVLGNDLLLETVSQEGEKTSVLMEWENFEKAQYLDAVEVLIETVRTDLAPGTRLTIAGDKTQLNEWTEKQYAHLMSELKKLMPPISADLTGSINVEEFKINIVVDGFFDNSMAIIRETVEPYPIFDFFDYRIAGKIGADGKGLVTYAVQRARNTTEEQLVLDFGAPTGCGDLVLDIRVYDRESDAIEALIGRGLKDESGNYVGKLEARRLLNIYNGIGVYRNGFRIRPLGDADFDWLTLNEQRVQNPSLRIGSNQVIGFVQIQSEEQSGLIEKSARDGLRENESFLRLKIVTGNVISKLEERRFDYRRKIGLGRRTLKTEKELIRLLDFDSLKTEVGKTLLKDGTSEQTTEKIIELIKKDEKEKTRIVEDVRQAVAIYQGQATLGKIITVILHEGRRPLTYFKNQIPNMSYWNKSFVKSGDPVWLEKLIPASEGIGQNAEIFVKLFGRLDPLASVKRSDKEFLILKKAISEAFAIFEADMCMYKITGTINCSDDFRLLSWKCIFRFIRPTFRRYPASHSGRIRPSVPVRSGQPFRWDPANASFRMPALP